MVIRGIIDFVRKEANGKNVPISREGISDGHIETWCKHIRQIYNIKSCVYALQHGEIVGNSESS